MTDVIDAVARAVARAEGRAFVVRSARLLGDDPARTFAVAPLRIVAEDVVQALAYGPLDPTGRPGPDPALLARWNPLSRDATDLLPFAAALDAYLDGCAAAEALPRIWLPHRPALGLLDLLGRRYEHNRAAPPELHRMGAQCRVLAAEAAYVGQQVVAVAADVLRDLVVTGQSPTEDAHLGSLLAWVSPPPGLSPGQVRAVADGRALVPATGVLPNLPGRMDDDTADRLRLEAKRPGPRQARARAGLEELLRQGARREWDLLVEARAAYLALGLPAADGAAGLARLSGERTVWALAALPSASRHAPALATLLGRYEQARGAADDAASRSDALHRERQRRTGRAIGGVVVDVRERRPGRRPCTLSVRTDQPVVRARVGTRLSPVGSRFVGTVVAVVSDPGGETVLVLDAVGKHCRVTERPGVGWTGDWIAPGQPDLAVPEQKAQTAMIDAADPVLVAGPLPPATARGLPAGFADSVLAGRRP